MILRDPYRPHPKQREAHAARESVVLYAGGYGSGKSWWLVREPMYHFERDGGKAGVLVAPTYRLLHSVLFPAILDSYPGASRWPKGKDRAADCLGPLFCDWSEKEHVLTWHSGQRLFLRSAENEAGIEGLTVSFVGLEEVRLVTARTWKILIGRMRSGDRQRFSLSGVPAAPWVRDEFYGASRSRGVPGEIADRRMVQCSTLDNPFLKPTPAEYVARMRLSPQRARTFVHGDFSSYEGAVYGDAYDSEESVLDYSPLSGAVSYGALDFGYRRSAFLLVQETVHPTWGGADVLCAEIMGRDQTEAAHARDIVALCQRHKISLQDVFCDPAGGAVNTQTGIPAMRVYREVLKEGGVLRGDLRASPRPGNAMERHIPNGVEATRSRFLDAMGRRNLFVAKSLTKASAPGSVGIHMSLGGYRYPEDGRRDEPVKDGTYDHACDALRYFILGKYGVGSRLVGPDKRVEVDVPTQLGGGSGGIEPWGRGGELHQAHST